MITKNHRVSLMGVLFLCLLVCGCSRKKGTCKKDSHCSGAQVCFEGACVSIKQLETIREQRQAESKPKVCHDQDADGVKAGDGCEKSEPVDCNDKDANMAPGKSEVCDGVDNDCDGMVNEGLSGCVQTLFGGATWGNQEQHRLDRPSSVWYDPAGFVIVTDNHHVWKVTLEGEVSLLAGSKLSNFKDGIGVEVRFSYPMGITPMPDGSYIINDCKNNCVRKLAQDGTTSTVAGLCSNLTKNTDQFMDGAASASRFYCPVDAVALKDGSLAVVDRGNARIRKISSAGEVSTIAGVGAAQVEEGIGQLGFADGPLAEAKFNDPQSILVDPRGILFVAESFNCRIRRIDLKKGLVSTYTGVSDTELGVGGHADGPLRRAKFSYPHGIAWDGKGGMLVADTGNAVIRLVRAGSVRTLYGKPGDNRYQDGPIAQARFQSPMDVAVGPNRSIFVVDTEANRIRWVVP